MKRKKRPKRVPLRDPNIVPMRQRKAGTHKSKRLQEERAKLRELDGE